MARRLWVLRPDDVEGALIEQLLLTSGEAVAYAVGPDLTRVQSGNAGEAVGYLKDGVYGYAGPERSVVFVECDMRRHGWPDNADVRHLDHHRPGDPGYGRPPGEFLAASSIGQVYRLLHSADDRGHYGFADGRWYLDEWWREDTEVTHPADGVVPGLIAVPLEYVFAAAADHCLGAAYQGKCPGVNPDHLMVWRIKKKALHQGRPEREIMAAVIAAKDKIYSAELLRGGRGDHPVRDCRGPIIPELPEAAVRLGEAVLAGPLDTPDGRMKYVMQCAEPAHVEDFLADRYGLHLVDMYGDPARGFAGGYTGGDRS